MPLKWRQSYRNNAIPFTHNICITLLNIVLEAKLLSYVENSFITTVLLAFRALW